MSPQYARTFGYDEQSVRTSAKLGVPAKVVQSLSDEPVRGCGERQARSEAKTAPEKYIVK